MTAGHRSPPKIQMCGIAGIIGRVPDIEARANRMSAAIAHRGPDNHGSRKWGGAGSYQTAFANRRLSIIDLSEAGRQPMETADGRYSIIYNGEIYNYLDLRDKLIARGIQFSTNTDTEVLLRLYEQHGPECLQLLRGMFAFAIRDNENGEVFIARDRLGIKPMYYHASGGASGGSFTFCSELRGVLSSGLAPRVLDPVSLNSYLSFGAVQEPRTIIEGVRSLPPAHYIVINAQGEAREPVSYWKLPATRSKVSRTDAVAETRARLEESVRLHLIADVPLGAFLSGGVDSSAVVALMARHASGWVKTFTVCFEEQEFSEHHLARKVAEKWETHHTEIILSEGEMLASLPEAVSDIDQPTIDGINTWVISRATRQAGITVSLSGLGGDELFGGYPSFSRARTLQRYGLPMNWLTSSARERVARLTTTFLRHSLAGQKVGSTISAGSDLLSAYASMRGLFSRTSRNNLIKAANREVDMRGDYAMPAETIELINNGSHNGNAGGDIFNRISRYELCLYMGNMLLRDTDAMSMASSLEVRVPLLDHELVEWVYSLPGSMKVGAHPKQLLIEAIGLELPPEISGRKKMGFALPFERWLRTSLKPFVSDTLNDADAVLGAGLNPQEVSNVVERFERHSRSTSWSRVWGLAVLVDWCRRHQVRIAE
jgi:asparagine synthase (glutamine-hydrolysing)